MSKCNVLALGVVICGLVAISGCSEKSGQPHTGATESSTSAAPVTEGPKLAAATDKPAELAAAKSEEAAAETQSEAASAPAVETDGEKHSEQLPTEKIAAAAEPAPTAEILLGTAELTQGIPGEGTLTTEQIDVWLNDPKNHVVLKPTLPFGLAAAAGQLVEMVTNPLTKAKIELGRQLYFDTRLSADNTVSCASCHSPEFGYAMNTQFGEGTKGQKGGRNSPVAYNRILSSVQFWDGRAATLEEQAKGPIANPIEMSNTHDVCVSCVGGVEGYKIQFDKVFPGEGVTIDNIAKAIASFERALVTGASPGDCMRAAEFQQLILERPVVILMNDSREFLIEKDQTVMVGDHTAGFLVDDEGVRRNAVITLSNIASVTSHRGK